MGMDIFIVEYHGKDEHGYLKINNVGREYGWFDERHVIRHRFPREVEQYELHSGIYGDGQAFYRPTNFKDAFHWAETLEEGAKEYVKKLLNILLEKDTLYLEYSY